MRDCITVLIPKGFMNCVVTRDDVFNREVLTANTNDSVNWDTLRFPLSGFGWRIDSVKGKVVVLCRPRGEE